jgi:hypothetical protein
MKSELKSKAPEFVHLVLSDTNLVVEDEEEVFKFSLEYFEEWGDIEVFKFVIFGRLSVEFLSSIIGNLSISGIIGSWPSLCQRLLLPIDETSSSFKSLPLHRTRPQNRTRTRTESFTSLIDFFNSHSFPLTASSSTVNSSSNLPQNALSHGTDYRFYSENTPNSWWRVDFGRTLTIESYTNFTNHLYESPCNWDFEVSKDGSTFEIIESRRNCDTYQRTSAIELEAAVECKSIRITQKGKNHNGNDYLFFYEIDFKGRIELEVQPQQ